jgi:hypothetical protein
MPSVTVLPPEPIPTFVLARARAEFDGPLAALLAEDGLDARGYRTPGGAPG